MSESRSRSGVGASLQVLWHSGAIGGLGDAELLDMYVASGDENAFAALVDRHGAMVVNACRAVLGDPHDIQDASQATFLILARKAASIRRSAAIGPWLFGVARRVSLRARDESRRRRSVNRKLAEIAASSSLAGPPECWADLHEEIDRLPSVERAAVVLCDLEGLAHDDAATRLSWPVRTVRKRLYRGRDRLRDRLIRRGLAPATALIGMASTIEAAPLLSVPSASSRAVALAEGVCRAMLIPSGKAVAASLIAFGGLLIGGAWAIVPRDEQKPAAGAAAAKPAQAAGDARTLLRKAAEAAIASKIPAESFVLDVIARAQAEAGDREGAARTLRHAAEDAGKAEGGHHLFQVAIAQIADGFTDDARTNLRRASMLAAGGTARANGSQLLTVIHSNQVRIKDREGASETLAAIRSAFEKVDHSPGGFHEGQLISALVASGDIDETFARIAAMRADPERKQEIPGALGSVMSGAEALDDATASALADRVMATPEWKEIPPEQKVFLSETLARTLGRVGRIDEARKVATSIAADPNGPIDTLWIPPTTLHMLSLEQAMRGDLAGAKETARIASSFLREHPKMQNRSDRLGLVAGA